MVYQHHHKQCHQIDNGKLECLHAGTWFLTVQLDGPEQKSGAQQLCSHQVQPVKHAGGEGQYRNGNQHNGVQNRVQCR